MKEWLLFTLFILCGLVMLISGVVYLQREKEDPESVKIYGAISAIGVVLIGASVFVRFIL